MKSSAADEFEDQQFGVLFPRIQAAELASSGQLRTWVTFATCLIRRQIAAIDSPGTNDKAESPHPLSAGNLTIRRQPTTMIMMLMGCDSHCEPHLLHKHQNHGIQHTLSYHQAESASKNKEHIDTSLLRQRTAPCPCEPGTFASLIELPQQSQTLSKGFKVAEPLHVSRVGPACSQSLRTRRRRLYRKDGRTKERHRRSE